MKRRIILICLLALFCSAFGGRWLTATEPIIDGFDYVEADLRDVLRSLGIAGGFNVLLTRDVAGTYTLYIKQPMRVRDAIEMVARTYGYDVRWLNEEKTVVVVGGPETLKQNFDLNLGLTKVFSLRYSAVAEIAEALRVVVAAGKISLNPRTNQVVVTGSPLELENATEIIAQMDHPMPQVNIEARMEEILESEVENLGLTWNAQYSLSFGPGASVVDGPTLIGKLNALHSEDKATTIAQPNASCLDSQEATIFIGDKYPVATSTVVEGREVWSVRYEDIGTKLTIRPRVNKENVVTVYVKAEVSSILHYEDLVEAGRYPVIRTRTTESLTRLRNGQTFVMSGLIRRDDKTKQTGIPFLDRLPILSLFFKNKETNRTGTVICVFLTPYIQQVAEDELSDVKDTAATMGGTMTGETGGGSDVAGGTAAGATAATSPNGGTPPASSTVPPAGTTGSVTIVPNTPAGDELISAEEMAERADPVTPAVPADIPAEPAFGAPENGSEPPAETPAADAGEPSPPPLLVEPIPETAPPVTAAPSTPSMPRPEEIKHLPYQVKKGDTLAAIGRKFGVPWPEIAAYNNLDGNAILRPGQRIMVPIPDSHKYVVKPKETLWRIAKRYGTTVELLMEINGLTDPARIEIGQVIVLPCPVSRVANPEY